MKHNWKHAPANADYHWICSDCRMLEFAAIPDTSQECSGSISKKIEDEIGLQPMKYWQNDQTMKVMANEFRPSPMWQEIDEEEYKQLS